VARTTGTLSLHMIDLERNIFSPLTRGTEDEQSPLWTPDGASIVFRSSRSTAPGIYRRGAGGASTSDELLLTAPEPLTPTGFSSDGQRLLFTKGGGPNQRIWILPVAGSPETRKPAQVFPGSTLIQSQARLSPDDKWIVYSEGPRPAETNVYIQPYPPNGTREQISPAGGRSPFWTKDGRHILYRADGDSVMSVELRPAGNTFRPATPVELFNRPPTTPVNHLFDVDDRGERFLFVLPPDRPVPVTPAERVPMTVIVNFAANIGKK
jgi:Tol biopolymer transport system component